LREEENGRRKDGGKMDHEERLIFSELISAYKQMWITHQEFKYLSDHRNADPEEVHGEFVETAYDLFQPLNEALLEGQPLQDVLRRLVLEIQHPLEH
jgi:hypothetical protein